MSADASFGLLAEGEDTDAEGGYAPPPLTLDVAVIVVVAMAGLTEDWP